jgi:small subunit ribosomal protein S15
MARMHSKKHGKSKSRKPVLEPGAMPEGLTLGKEQIVEIISSYSKQGLSPAAIGEKLKKEHNVPYIKQAMGKRLSVILKENGQGSEIPPDLMDLMKKAVRINQHMAKNKQDMHNRTNLRRAESKIWRLSKYYIGTGVLPSTWRYDPQQAALLIKGKV